MITKFNKMVLMVASILLILGLIIIGIIIARTLAEEVFPPVVTDCPDYWNVTYNASNQVECKNNQINSGKADADCRSYPTTLFAASGSSDADITCEKSKWAKRCNIHWDGITNNPKACTNTTM